VKMTHLTPMAKTFSTAEVKAHFSESIDIALEEGYVIITRYGKPIAALVSYEDLAQLQRLRSANQTGGLAHLAEDWEDSENFAQELAEIAQERT
ncbi:MAG: type II toxin-antitoxin system Phd/YefM family antitoxin, partial [Microcystaceae cyanobacterium]